MPTRAPRSSGADGGATGLLAKYRDRVCVWSVAVIACLAVTACAPRPTTFGRSAKRTCVVLSVGGLKGVAHTGALAALHERGIRVDCVIGNSMGALVGALFVTAPQEPASARLRTYLATYVQATKDEVTANAGLGALIGAVLTGGIGGVLVGGAAGAVTVDHLDYDRAVDVLRRMANQATIESLPIPFATFYSRRAEDGLETVAAIKGDVADAVGRSMSNPFIFSDVNVRDQANAGIDPGADRVAAIPIEDACRLFPDARLIAVNVTGQEAFYSAGMRCPVLTVKVAVPKFDAEDVARGGDDFEALVRAGYDAATSALAKVGM